MGGVGDRVSFPGSRQSHATEAPHQIRCSRSLPFKAGELRACSGTQASDLGSGPLPFSGFIHAFLKNSFCTKVALGRRVRRGDNMWREIGRAMLGRVLSNRRRQELVFWVTFAHATQTKSMLFCAVLSRSVVSDSATHEL